MEKEVYLLALDSHSRCRLANGKYVSEWCVITVNALLSGTTPVRFVIMRTVAKWYPSTWCIGLICQAIINNLCQTIFSKEIYICSHESAVFWQSYETETKRNTKDFFCERDQRKTFLSSWSLKAVCWLIHSVSFTREYPQGSLKFVAKLP